MADPFSPIDESQCELIRDPQRRSQLVELFNKTLELYRWLKESRSLDEEIRRNRVLNKEPILRRVYGDLTCKEYSVGFLGPFQSGKSHTFNNVLRAKAGEEPAKPGNSEATTAVVTRLHRVDRGGHRLRLTYCNTKEYDDLRNYLKSRTGFPPSESDGSILASAGRILDNWEQSTRKSRDESGNEIPVLKLDVAYLAMLLKSRQTLGEKVRDTALVDDRVPFAHRNEYLNHPDTGEWHTRSRHAPLLSAADIYYQTDVIPPTVRMIDLPGLGSTCSVDLYRTKRFVKDLQGALVFCKADAIQTADVEMICNWLRGVLGSAARQNIWLVFTKMDVLKAGHFIGSKTVLEGIRDVVLNLNLNPDNVHLVTNFCESFHSQVGNNPEYLSKIQEALNKEGMEAIRQAWEQLCFDGGISALRHLIADELAEKIACGVQSRCLDQLHKLYKELLGVAQKNTIPQLTTPALLEAQTCRAFLMDEMAQVLTDVGRAQPVVVELQTALQGSFDAFRPERTIVGLEWRQLQGEFEQHAPTLERVLRTQMATVVLARSYEDVETRLADFHNTHQELPSSNNSLAATWKGFQLADEDSHDWYGPEFPSFVQFSPFEQVGGENQFDGREYVDMMQEKIKVVSRQVGQRIRVRLHERLDTILSELTGQIRKALQDTEPDDQWLQRLEQFETFARNAGIGEG